MQQRQAGLPAVLEPMPPCLQPWQLWQLEASKVALLMELGCHWLLVPQKRQSVSSLCDFSGGST